MGNLCSIFHLRFKHLIQVIPSARKAQLMDYLLLGWQTSTYKLKGSDKKWFMKPYAEIITDTNIPKSSLERYIKEFVDEGFIERRHALYSRTKLDGGFEVKKGTYIYITERLLNLLTPSVEKNKYLNQEKEKNTHKTANSITSNNDSKKYIKKLDCIKLEKNEGTDPLKMRGSYIGDLYTSLKNTITFKKLNLSVDTHLSQRLVQQFESIKKFLFSEIKEEIPEEIKKHVLGTFFNLTFKHHKFFSSPQQLIAEYLYALLNTEFYLPSVNCFKHRNNILSKIIRFDTWQTPKGFYKHFYLGENFKDKQIFKEKRWQEIKAQEINPILFGENKEFSDTRLTLLEAKMLEKSTLIENLTSDIYQQECEEAIFNLREKIKKTKNELENLWVEQRQIEEEITSRPLKQCA